METVLQDGVTCLKLSNPAGFSGKQQFTCSYTLPCRAAEAADGQQFRLSLPETGWDYAIDSYTLTMTFPAEVTNAPEWTSGYYGDVVDNYLDIRTQENTVTAKSTAAMRDHETLTVAVQFPADTFNLRDQPGKTAGFDRIAFLVLLAAAVAFWFLRLRSGLILPRAQQTIGMESTAGEIPCQLLGEAPDAAGMIVHWGNLGYLTVRMSRGRVILYKRMEMGNERKPSERRFFAALFRAGASCEAGGLRYQAAVREMQAPILTGWRRRMFTGGNPLVLRLLGAAAGLFASLLTFDRLLPATGSRWVWLPVLTALGTAACRARAAGRGFPVPPPPCAGLGAGRPQCDRTCDLRRTGGLSAVSAPEPAAAESSARGQRCSAAAGLPQARSACAACSVCGAICAGQTVPPCSA